MPWFPELEIGRALAARAERLPFFAGIESRDAEQLARSFAAEPLVDDPRHGRVSGSDAFARYVEAQREWLREEARGVDPVRLTLTPERSVEEVSVRLPGDHPELPVAIVTDFADDGRLRAIRVATVREPSGGPYTFTGQAHHDIYVLQFANGGGIPLRFCTVTDDGTACAIEYACDRWGRDAIPPQAGVAVYERGASGKLAAARIYDDVTPPESSDSSARPVGQ